MRKKVMQAAGLGGEPLWLVPNTTSRYSSRRLPDRKSLEQAAPANVSTRDNSIRVSVGPRIPKQHRGTKHRLRQFAGAACLTPGLAFLVAKQNTAGSLGTIQSGSPPSSAPSRPLLRLFAAIPLLTGLRLETLPLPRG
jgi:hypothetical protein